MVIEQTHSFRKIYILKNMAIKKYPNHYQEKTHLKCLARKNNN